MILKNGGDIIEDCKIYPVNKVLDNSDVRVVIAVGKYAPVVMQLEHMGLSNYVYYADIYGWQLNCKSRLIMDRHVHERSVGQFVGRDIKNGWMNHMVCPYSSKRYEEYMSPGAKILDVGCGCGTYLFWELLNGFDAYGLDCCKWKLDFCKQKIEDFYFPKEWGDKLLFGYGENLPFESASFDIATSWYVLEHVNNWEQCLKEMVRVVKPGGALFINGPDYRNSYEEHYGIDIGKPINKFSDVLRKILIEKHENLDIFDELNFITKDMILKCLQKMDVEIIDDELDSPRVDRVEGKLRIWRRIDLIAIKH